MRKATQDKGLIVIDGKFIGIALGFDFTAEHEWGVEDLRRRFGIADYGAKSMLGKYTNLGIKSRMITKNIDCLIFIEETYKKNKYALLYTGNKFHTREENEKYIPRDLESYKKDILWNKEWEEKHPRDYREPEDPIVTAWDGSSFGVGVMGETEVGYLKELFEEFKKKNIAIATINLSPRNPFSRGSLSLLIADRIPQDALDQMYSADKEHFDLIDYEKKIGMTDLKEKTKGGDYKKLHYYCACSAKWIDYDNKENREAKKKELNTKYDIQYWINYSDDDENYGWYNVEDIMTWLKGSKKLTEIRKVR